MKLQINILITILKKYKYWILAFLFLFLVSYILSMVSPNTKISMSYDFFTMIGYPVEDNLGFISLLVTIYQLILYIFLFTQFIFYEFNYSLENILIRADSRKWLMQKIIISILATILLKCIYIAFTYLLFSHVVTFNIKVFCYPIAILLVTLAFLIFNLNFPKLYANILTIVDSCLLLYLFFHFNIKLLIGFIIISLVMFLYTILNFRFKKVL